MGISIFFCFFKWLETYFFLPFLESLNFGDEKYLYKIKGGSSAVFNTVLWSKHSFVVSQVYLYVFFFVLFCFTHLVRKNKYILDHIRVNTVETVKLSE